MSIYFMLWVRIQYYVINFLPQICSSLGHNGAFRVVPVSLWLTPGPISFLALQDASGSSCYFPAAPLGSAISPRVWFLLLENEVYKARSGCWMWLLLLGCDQAVITRFPLVILIYIFVSVCVCVCVSVFLLKLLWEFQAYTKVQFSVSSMWLEQLSTSDQSWFHSYSPSIFLTPAPPIIYLLLIEYLKEAMNLFLFLK